MAEEYEVSPGRYLVSANMGEGWDRTNGSKEAVHALKRMLVCSEFTILTEMRAMTGEYPLNRSEPGSPYFQYHGSTVRNFIKSAEERVSKLTELIDAHKTLCLELAWLHGDKETVRRILNGKD